MTEAECLVVDTLTCSEHPSQMFNLLVKTESTVKFSHRKNLELFCT